MTRKKKRQPQDPQSQQYKVPTYDDSELETEWNARPGILAEQHRRRQNNLQTTMANPLDRMMRYGKNPPCPACNSANVACLMKWPDEPASFRCRQCGHRFLVGRSSKAA